MRGKRCGDRSRVSVVREDACVAPAVEVSRPPAQDSVILFSCGKEALGVTQSIHCCRLPLVPRLATHAIDYSFSLVLAFSFVVLAVACACRDLFSQACVCVCVCVRACARVCGGCAGVASGHRLSGRALLGPRPSPQGRWRAVGLVGRHRHGSSHQRRVPISLGNSGSTRSSERKTSCLSRVRVGVGGSPPPEDLPVSWCNGSKRVCD